jgi:hypothetical protein
MALSRFFTVIIVASIGWAFVLLLMGRMYSLTPMVNGKQGDAIIIAEKDSQQLKGEDSSLLNKIKEEFEEKLPILPTNPQDIPQQIKIKLFIKIFEVVINKKYKF